MALQLSGASFGLFHRRNDLRIRAVASENVTTTSREEGEKVKLGGSDVKVTKLGIGAWAWGDTSYWNDSQWDDRKLKAAEGAFDASIDGGITFFDTAEVYGAGFTGAINSETLLGRFIKERQKMEPVEVAVATKFAALPWRFGRGSVLSALKASLSRLGLSSVDLYQLHWPGIWGNEGYIDGLGDAVEQGLVKAVGVSNYSEKRLRDAYDRLKKRGIPLASNQVNYSLIYRNPEENGVKAACDELGITLIAYSPIAQGALTGKYTPENLPTGPRGRIYTPEFLTKLQPLISRIKEIGENYGKTSTQPQAMNHCVPDWSMEDDLRSFHGLFPAANEKKSTPAPDNELVELLWRNGHVVMQSQTNRKPPPSPQPQKPDPQLKPVNPGNIMQEDETAQWFQYALEDSLEKEFCPEFLCEMPIADTVDASRPNKEVVGEGDTNVKCRATEDGSVFTMPPPKSHNGAAQLSSSLGNGGGHVNFSHFSRPVKSGSGIGVGMGETSSSRTVGSSACGSNQVQNQGDVSHTMMSNGATGVLGKGVKEGGLIISPRDGVRASTFDATVTSSSGGSGCSFGRTTRQRSTSNQTNKRKGRDGDDSEYHSEEAEYESMEANQSTQRPTSTRKSRATEVHNLSERRRRDRINEKMRALQELIPHCNKSDKASMLDEAIDYLKSLQLQLQLMWMGSGMAPAMFPGVQQYMSRVGIGMGHVSMHSISNPMQLSRAPLVNHTVPSAPPAGQMPMCPSPTVNPINFPAQMQNVHLPESYARYFGFPHMQLPPQAMNLYTYGSHMMQQNQAAAVAGSSSASTSGIPRSENLQNGHSG